MPSDVLTPTKSTRSGKACNVTSWIPTKAKKMFGLAMMGLTILPTHLVAMPSQGMKPFPIPVQTHATPVPEPLSHTPDLEKLRACHAVLDRWNMLQNPHAEDTRWTIAKILKISNKEVANGDRSIFCKTEFGDGARAWMTMDTLHLEDPYLVIDHVFKHDMADNPGFEWIQPCLESDSEHLSILAARKKAFKPIKFGVEVARNVAHAFELDKKHGNRGWAESMKRELDQLHDFKTFRVVPDGVPMPKGFKRIPYHMVFDVKFDGRLKAGLLQVDTEPQRSTKRTSSPLLSPWKLSELGSSWPS